jgi:ketosteroid isomerase-like protein
MLILLLASVAFTQADTAATKSAILEADRSLAAAVASKGAQVFLDALAPDAAVLFPGQPVLKGAAGARSAFLARYDAPSSLTWNPVHAVVSTDGRLGCTMGYSRFRNPRDTAKVERRGMYLTCWTKGANGNWQVAGTQLADSPPQTPVLADSATLPAGPHSATVSIGLDFRRTRIGARRTWPCIRQILGGRCVPVGRRSISSWPGRNIGRIQWILRRSGHYMETDARPWDGDRRSRIYGWSFSERALRREDRAGQCQQVFQCVAAGAGWQVALHLRSWNAAPSGLILLDSPDVHDGKREPSAVTLDQPPRARLEFSMTAALPREGV